VLLDVFLDVLHSTAMHPLGNVPDKSKSNKRKSVKVPELDDTTDIEELTDNDPPQSKKQKTSGLRPLRRTGELSFYLF